MIFFVSLRLKFQRVQEGSIAILPLLQSPQTSKGWRTKKIAKMEEFKEEWRPVVGYEGKYEVSNLGKVDALDFHRQGIRRALKQVKLNSGYIRVTLYKNGVPTHYQVHRVVASAFIPNPNNYPCINHKDENKENNVVSNLEWCTILYNNNYGTTPQRISEKNSFPVIQMSMNDEFIAEYTSVTQAARKTGATVSGISAVCRGELRKSFGYKWRYVDEKLYAKSLQKRKSMIDAYTSKGHINIKDGRAVLLYSNDGTFIREYKTIADAAKDLSLDRSGISKVCRGKNKSSKGYIFRYKE